MPDKDYTKKVLYTLIAVALSMMCIVFIPGYTLGGISIKRANIVSDLLHFDDESLDKFKTKDKTNLYTDTTLFQDFPDEVMEQIEDEIEEAAATTNTTDTKDIKPVNSEIYRLPFIPIEDYSGDSMMYKFYDKLRNETSNRIVRIAFCGDSFIEGDILTSDIREMLQSQFGGRGIGFTPFSHPLMKYRSTLSSSTIGWTDYSIMKRKQIPEKYLHSMYISGNISIPTEETARCFFKGTGKKKFLDYSEQATILFKNTKPSNMTVTINDTIKKVFQLETKEDIQSISIKEKIVSIGINLSETDGFIGYGICMDGNNGIAVDNYSIRGNSGLALFSTDLNANTQIGQFLKYDLVVLQYGLNVMSENNFNYTAYKNRLKQLIGYIKLCFPNSAVIVMGVSDRGTRIAGEMRTMNCVQPMISEQHSAAIETGVAFWNTFEAMGGENSIVGFEKKGMAGKDFTHINLKGGKFIAEKVIASMEGEMDKMTRKKELEDLKSVAVKYPDQVVYKKDINLERIVVADRHKHKIVSRGFWKTMRRW